ncbi:hypothetical protein O6H91_15G072000 [Diphasiastrum complanatum]|uniref:Uncharacterized protein n=3 Tax=Diphasiastrum complanatum TaxID=34168 RepID=A0ACC2BJJ6_DIPCM|nr:hypothetical protein O6H91_15G072000 [Diphasiastrum complanatum]KAJ7529942.1 hypothetical protein O6H91_15G072000 [Diphasiastrum complanatum]KAJ7529943.1 hypothetical protein O6H91_15G072000 [Diphasiastrum complanatum]
MTRVVVQRGQASSNSSQNRSTAPPSSALSSPPAPPPLPPPPPPLPPRPSAPYSRPSSSRFHGNHEPDFESKLDSLYCDGHSKPNNRKKEPYTGEVDFAKELGDGRKKLFPAACPNNTGLISAENIDVTEISGADTSDRGLEFYSGIEGHRRIVKDISYEVDKRIMPLDHSISGVSGAFATDRKADDRESVYCKGPISVFPSRPHYHFTSQTSSQFSSDQLMNTASTKGSSSAPLPVLSSILPPNLTCTEMLDETGLAKWTRETIDQGRSGSFSHISESSCAIPSLAAFSLSSSSKALGSSRRSAWTGIPCASGNRAAGLSRRPSKNIKAVKCSPNSSRSTSPRSHEGDGYNSSDELAWTSGQIAYEDAEVREHQFENELRRAKGLEVRRMAEDGNCLFRAVADQVYGDPEMYDETRQLCIDYMETERDHFSQFVTESFTTYCKRKRRDKVYGNNLEIQAMAEMYNRPIHIHSYSAEPINIFHGSYETDLPPIRLSYHRGNHYNSLHDPSKPAVGAGLGFASLHGTAANRDQVKAALKAQQDQQIDKALLAEGRFFSDLELTEHEIELMVIEESRAEFLAEEKRRQQTLYKETSTSAGAEPSSSGTTSGSSKKVVDLKPNRFGGAPAADVDVGLSSNVRMLLSMGFNYVQVMEAVSIFGDDMNDILCYLLEMESISLEGESIYRMKGKAAER